MAKELHNFDGNEVIATELPQYLNQNFTAIPSSMGVWEKGEEVEVGDIRLLSGRENTGYILECVSSGTTGETQPVIIEEDANIIANYSDSGVVGRMRLIFNSAEKDVDEVFATGVVYNRSSYPELWEYAQLRAGLLIDEDEWQAKFIETNGKFVPYYSRGDGSTTFRTPLLGGYIKGAETSGDLGEFLEAGLPNVTGYIQARKIGNANATETYETVFADGKVFQASDTSGSYNIPTITTTTKPLRQLNFSLARGNAIYGNSNTVTPETMVGIWVIKAIGVIIDQGSTDLQDVLNGVNTNSQRITSVESNYLKRSGGTMTGTLIVPNIYKNNQASSLTIGVGSTWDNAPSLSLYGMDATSGVIGGFQLRAGEADYNLTGRADGSLEWAGKKLKYVTDTYNSGTSWYRVWSDGWIEQGGQILVTKNTEKAVTLLKSMSNTNYCVQGANISYYNNGRYACSPCCKKTSTTTVTLGNVEDVDVTYSWMVCGY